MTPVLFNMLLVSGNTTVLKCKMVSLCDFGWRGAKKTRMPESPSVKDQLLRSLTSPNDQTSILQITYHTAEADAMSDQAGK